MSRQSGDISVCPGAGAAMPPFCTSGVITLSARLAPGDAAAAAWAGDGEENEMGERQQMFRS